MNPAFSVILFTTLSGAGYGLLALVGMMIVYSRPELLVLNDSEFLMWFSPRIVALLATGVALTTIGLISSTFHLGKPLRAWRAFSQWRTSWLSREGVLALLTYVPAVALTVLLSSARLGDTAAELPLSRIAPWLGGALALLSLLTVACTAMIYASLKPAPAWRHWLVAPVYLVFALLTGFTLFMALQTLALSDPPLGIDGYFILVPNLWGVPAALAVVLATMKLVYWRDIDRIVLPSRESATALEDIGTVTTFERPHTEANYLTREMGFVLARKHSHKLRVIALVLFAGIPLLALLTASLLPMTTSIALWIAALAALVGTFVERWLFFAEAKHIVMLYY